VRSEGLIQAIRGKVQFISFTPTRCERRQSAAEAFAVGFSLNRHTCLENEVKWLMAEECANMAGEG